MRAARAVALAWLACACGCSEELARSDRADGPGTADRTGPRSERTAGGELQVPGVDGARDRRAADGPAGTRPRIYGVTADDVSSLTELCASLKALPHKPTTRIVFDQGQPPSAYAKAVPAIQAVSYVMGQILDSESMKSTSLSAYTQRTSDYLAAFPGLDIWEVGNEINGNWLGSAADVSAKMSGAFDLVKAAGKTTALTLYGCSDAGATYDMFNWVKANVPARMLTGLDYVLVSYYDGDCGAKRSDWESVFQTLQATFPNASVGFGEVGSVDSNGNDVSDPSVAGPILQKYYGMSISASRYIGGHFWWYFAEDMVPSTKPLFAILSAAMQ